MTNACPLVLLRSSCLRRNDREEGRGQMTDDYLPRSHAVALLASRKGQKAQVFRDEPEQEALRSRRVVGYFSPHLGP